MKRRSILMQPVSWMLVAAAGGVSAQGVAPPLQKVSAGQLQLAVAQRFPMRYPVSDLFDLEVGTPRLRLLPEQNRLATEAAVRLAGPALRNSYTGALDVSFALRYEASDRTVRAHQLAVRPLRLPGLSARALEVLDIYLPLLARELLGDVVLHTLRSRDLALSHAMGLQPGSITVTQDGLEIAFVASK